MIRTLQGKIIHQPHPTWASAGIYLQKYLEPAKLSRWITQQCNKFHDPESQAWIKTFANAYNIDRATIPECRSCRTNQECWDRFSSLNAFFARTRTGLPRVSKTRVRVVVAPADAYTMYLNDQSVHDRIWIKGTEFTLRDFFSARKSLASHLRYHLFIFRLAPHHYHRFHVPVCGWITAIRQVGSEYFSVHPDVIQSRVNVLTRNVRVLVQIETHSGDTLFLGIVGATCTGSICFSNPAVLEQFKRDTRHDECTDRTLASLARGYRPRRKIPIFLNDELGRFEYGGSTVVLCTPISGVQLSPVARIVVRHSSEPAETELKVGEPLLALTG